MKKEITNDLQEQRNNAVEVRTEIKIVENFTHYILYSDGRVWNTRTERFLGERTNKQGYIYVRLKDDQGFNHECYLHRLIYEAFKGEIPQGLQINHIDENKQNNHISNLELVTAKQNCNHGTRNERIAITAKGKSKVKNTFKVEIQSADGNKEELTINSITDLVKLIPSVHRLTWQNRLYHIKNPKHTYVEFGTENKVYFITPLNEEYKARVEAATKGKENN